MRLRGGARQGSLAVNVLLVDMGDNSFHHHNHGGHFGVFYAHVFSRRAFAGPREESQAVLELYSAQCCHMHGQVSRNTMQQLLCSAGGRADVMWLIIISFPVLTLVHGCYHDCQHLSSVRKKNSIPGSLYNIIVIWDDFCNICS